MVSIAANATATGSGSVANVHVLLSESEIMHAGHKAKVLQFRDLLNDLAGVPGKDGAMYLPTPIYDASRVLIPVSLKVITASHR